MGTTRTTIIAEPAPLPPSARYEVLHPELGPWAKGSVIQADVDLVGADVRALLNLKAVAPTDAPRNVILRRQ